jgi:polyisoprenoid-binding protein YceI
MVRLLNLVFKHQNLLKMKKQFFAVSLFAMSILISSGIVAQTKWVVDKTHSHVKFSVAHMVVSEVEGSFKGFDGSLVASKDNLSDAVVTFSVDVESVNTDNANRDKHLKSDDFFNAEKFPKMSFVGKSMKPLGGNKYKLTGDLTMRDVTKTIEFDVTYGGKIQTDQGGYKSGFKARATIDRTQFGVNFTGTLKAGGLAVGNNVDIIVNLEMNQAK